MTPDALAQALGGHSGGFLEPPPTETVISYDTAPRPRFSLIDEMMVEPGSRLHELHQEIHTFE